MNLKTTKPTQTTREPAPPTEGPEPPGDGPIELEGALDAVEHELAALPEGQLRWINVDIPTAFTTVWATLTALFGLRSELALLHKFRLASLDGLPGYLRAMLQAHVNYSHPPPAFVLAPTVADCAARFKVLQRATLGLMDADLLPADTLEAFEQEQGYVPTALDTLALVDTLRKNWPRLQGNTALTLALLEQTRQIASDVLSGVGKRGQLARLTSETVLTRQRAFTLFATHYEEVRRGVLYLRWYEDDAETFAPSIFTRGPRSKATAAPESPAPAPSEPTKPAAAPTGDTKPST